MEKNISNEDDEEEFKSRQYNIICKTLIYPKEERDKDDLKLLKSYFKQIKLFQNMKTILPKVQYHQLFNELKLETMKKHKTIFRLGDPSFKYYIILQGSVYIFGQGLDNTNEIENKDNILSEEDQSEINALQKINPNLKFLFILNEGQSFGEEMLNQKTLRNTTAICRENTNLASISSDSYYYIVEKYFMAIYEEKIEFLRQFNFLSSLSNTSLSNLLNTIQVKEFNKNQTVYKKYDPVSCIYLIRSGEFEIIQEIEAHQEEPEQAMEQYKQNIEEFYENFNQLNVQFHRTKQSELKKKQRIALLAAGQCFGLNEIAENMTQRQVSAVCTSLKAEVFMLEKQAYLNTIKDKQVYTDFLKENKMKQCWRKKQIECSKNLFQKIDYRKYNIQTNKSVKQIKGLCKVTLDGSQIQKKESPRLNNFILSQPSQEHIIIQRNNTIKQNQQGDNKNMNKKDRDSMSPRLEQEFNEEQIKSNTKLQVKNQETTRILINNNTITQMDKQDKKDLNKCQTDRDNQDLQIQQNIDKQSNFLSQRSILSLLLKPDSARQKQNLINHKLLFSSSRSIVQKSKAYLEDNSSKISQGNNDSTYCQEFSHPSQVLSKIQVESQNNNNELDLLSKRSINITQKDINKKKKSLKNFNTIKNKVEQKNFKENYIIKDQSNKSFKNTENTLTERNSLFGQSNNNNSSRRQINIIKLQRKKSLEAIRSEKLDSQMSLDMKQLFHTQEQNDRFKLMVEIENEMNEQYGKLQPPLDNQSQNINNKSRNSIASSQSLKCFEKSFQDAMQVIQKKQYLDSLSQKQYFNDIKSSLNIDKEEALRKSIFKRASIQPPPTPPSQIPVFQTIQSIARNLQTAGSTTSNRISTFYSASKESIKTPPARETIPSLNQENNFNENDIIKQQQQQQQKHEISAFQQDIKLDTFSYLINKNKFEFQDKNLNNESLKFRESQFTKSPAAQSISKYKQSNDNLIGENDNDNNNCNTKQIQTSDHNNDYQFDFKISPKNNNNNRISSPLNNSIRIASLNSIKNDDCYYTERNDNKTKSKKPFIIDYNFVDSSRSSKFKGKKSKRNIPYIESSATSQQQISTQNIEKISQIDQYSPLKYKRSLMIDCDETFPQKSTASTHIQATTPSRFSQLNAINNFQLLLKQDIDKKSPKQNMINQFEHSTFNSPVNAAQTTSLSNMKGCSSKSTASSSKPKFFKKDSTNFDFQQNLKQTSKPSQKQFLYQLLNRNQVNKNNNNYSKNDISVSSRQQPNYKFQESYYRSPINQQVITAYSSPRQLVFKMTNTSQTNHTNNTGLGNSSFLKKTPKNIALTNQSTNI